MPNSEQRARQRAHLLLRSSQLRADISLNVQALRRPLGLADQARGAVDWLSRNPQWPVGALLIVVAVRPRRAVRWASTLWWGYGLFRRAQTLLRRL
jgi:hypothetical protein